MNSFEKSMFISWWTRWIWDWKEIWINGTEIIECLQNLRNQWNQKLNLKNQFDDVDDLCGCYTGYEQLQVTATIQLERQQNTNTETHEQNGCNEKHFISCFMCWLTSTLSSTLCRKQTLRGLQWSTKVHSSKHCQLQQKLKSANQNYTKLD